MRPCARRLLAAGSGRRVRQRGGQERGCLGNISHKPVESRDDDRRGPPPFRRFTLHYERRSFGALLL
ncbi:hypothetical protein JYU34_022013 [Plutella xylostella]|uniref:Uncharacterized protein n=1 Tax=Plutella xylostella TaxID=51655 RepID=A0ABQ7PRU7_PLUXY|nr:hypothetical protein JYU34_022013 [Plutella xylostella]